MKKIQYLMAAAGSALAILGERFSASPSLPRVRVANTYDAAVQTHEASVRRTNESAVTTRHLLWTQGTNPGEVDIADADTPALGTIDNVEASTGRGQTLRLLGKGPTKKMVAAGEVAPGVPVYQAAGGKVDDEGTIQVGYSLTGSGQDDDIIEVNDHAPVVPENTPEG